MLSTIKYKMETRLINIKHIPDRQLIKSVLGATIYRCYELFCNTVISLSPKTETWSGKSRRGMFYHGFSEFFKTDFKYINMWIDDNTLKCEVHLSKRKFDCIVQNQNVFCDEMKMYINGSILTYLDFYIEDKTISDAIKIISSNKYVDNNHLNC